MRLTVTETPLSRLSDDLIGPSWRVSPNQRSVAWVETRKRKLLFKELAPRYRVVHNASATPDFDGVGSLQFSPDSARLACSVGDGRKWKVLIDGVAGPECDGLLSAPFAFSPDSRRIAYGVRKGDRFSLIVDGREASAHAALAATSIAFSADGKSVACAVRGDRGEWFALVDGAALKAWPNLAGPWLSPDGRVAYGAVDGKGKRIVVGDEEGPLFDDIAFLDAIAWRPDGASLAYAGGNGTQWCVVIDGHKQATFSSVAERFLVWGGTRLAYDAQVADGWCAVIDGERQQTFRDLGKGHFVFSANGERHAYVAVSQAGRQCVVLDGTALDPCDGIGHQSLRFSPDGKRFGYAMSRNDRWSMVVDGERGPEHEFIELVAWQFSPDGRHVAYVAERQGQDFFVVDDVESDVRFDAFVSDIVFDGPRRFHALAKRGDLVVTADVEIVD